MVLEKELDCFRRRFPELLVEANGKFVLIRADEVLGYFDGEGDAIAAGFAACGVAPFLVRRVEHASRRPSILMAN